MPKSKHQRIILDTNLWVSFIISNELRYLETLLFENRVRLLFSNELIQELKSTIGKPKLRKYFPDNSLEKMLNAFEPYVDFIHVKSKVDICRDPKDNFLLELAKDGKADYLLTGDMDLLEIKKFKQTEIVTFRNYRYKNSR